MSADKEVMRKLAALQFADRIMAIVRPYVTDGNSAREDCRITLARIAYHKQLKIVSDLPGMETEVVGRVK